MEAGGCEASRKAGREVRNRYEELERNILSPYAALSADSEGRDKTEEKCLVRTDFQRDKDRIIYSKAFRRLKHKTQVFISPEGDHYRTRLTHTLEVSQIARTIARALRLNEDLTEAIALGHDLGHTPFGHAGERVLNSILSFQFKHNEHGIRVVEKLEGKEHNGLNLTKEVRDGILNHVGSGTSKTLEGRIVRYADRIAYINHDIEDAIRGKVLMQDDIPKEFRTVLGETSSSRINRMILDIINCSDGKNEISMSPEIGEATNGLHEFMFREVYIDSSAKTEENKAQWIIEMLFAHFIDHPGDLPEDIKRTLENEGKERAVCDFIAGMTDRYALNMFEKLFIPKSWEY